MCTSQFHLWYATLTSALSCTSPWNISFAFVDRLQFAFETLICASWLHTPTSALHLAFASLVCNSQVHLPRAAFVHTSQLQLSLEPLVQLPCVPRSFTSRLNLSLVAFALTCKWHRSFSPLIRSSQLRLSFGRLAWTVYFDLSATLLFCTFGGHL